MKARYTTVDIVAAISEIKNSSSIGLRVANVYDIDNKTFLVRLTHGEIKSTILVESGNRIHLTEYDWPKSMMPSGFSMKVVSYFYNIIGRLEIVNGH
ncbi:ribosome quality control complex subunit NEMF-like [Hydra vulgaris]|uniref:Ribosome quality control complex subunit NEMF-like n=1 Tax=Hydra vulgaris TaxID=6087 RepID=A0ABM4DBI9_HYDVU